MELIKETFEFLSTKPEFGYFLIGVIVGIKLGRYIVSKIYTIITMVLIGLLGGGAIAGGSGYFNSLLGLGTTNTASQVMEKEVSSAIVKSLKQDKDKKQ